MPATPDVAVPDQGLLSRAIGMIVSPGTTFRTVVAHPRPATILFVVCLVLGLAKGLPLFSEPARKVLLDTQVQFMEGVLHRDMTPEMYDALKQGAARAPYTTILGTFVFGPVFSLIFAGVFWVVFNAILGGTASFKQVLAIVTHSQVIAAVGEIVAAPIVWFNGSAHAAGPFNFGALVPMMDPKNPVVIFLAAISFFALWQFAVTGIGLSVLYRRKGAPIAVALMAVYALVFGGGAVAISSFMNR